MDRIAELLAKGIETLTPEELAELDTLISEEADALLDIEAPGDDELAQLQELAEARGQVTAENTRREEAEQARIARRDELAAQLRGEPAAEETATGDEPAAEATTDGDGGEAAEPAAEATEERVPVTAAAGGVAVLSGRVSVPRPARSQPRQAPSNQAALTAAMGVPGIAGGSRLDTTERLFAAWDSAVNLAMTASGDVKIPVAVSRVEFPDALVLGRDAYLNQAKIEARTSPEAVTASGGICAPVPYRYDLPTVGETGRPVRDSAMARFGVQGTRGGVKTLVPPTIEDVDGVTGPVSFWTEANDQSPSNPTTKPYLTIPCTNTESESRVYAIPLSFKVGNFRERWFPENVRAFQNLAAVWQARVAEAKLLQSIAAGSKVVSHGQVLGSAQDTMTAIRQLIAGIRYRHRLGRSVRFRVIGFEWVLDNIVTDMIRKGSGDVTDARLRMQAEAEVNAYFAALGVNVTWSPDYEYGKTIGQAGGPFAGTQGVGAVIGYPSIARFYVYMEGAWLFLDGGELNLGVIRDSSLVGTNDMLMFSETFEGAHFHHVPGESYVYDIDLCANGGIASALDITPCVSGS